MHNFHIYVYIFNKICSPKNKGIKIKKKFKENKEGRRESLKTRTGQKTYYQYSYLSVHWRKIRKGT